MKATKTKYEFVDDMLLTGEMKDETVYVEEKYHMIGHLCPCGCREAVVIPYQHPGNHDGWELEIKDDLISLRPSILRMSGCKSHYFITENKIIWCE